MKVYTKRSVPPSDIRGLLEPGPVILVSSAWQGKRTIMTMGWHMMMGDSTVGCFVWTANRSRHLIEKSGECVVNVPTVDIAREVVGIGNISGRSVDKFAKFGLTAVPATEVSAPLIGECYASYECRLVDTTLARDYSLFIFDVVKGHAAARPKYPRTIHYRGSGVFMVSGENTSRYRRLFRREML